MELKEPRARYFFSRVFISGVIGLMIAAMVCIMTSCARKDIKNGELRYEKAVFIGAAGKSFPPEQELKSIDNLGRYAGVYLKDALDAGIGVKEGIVYLIRAREIVSEHDPVTADKLVAILKERYGISLPQSIYSASVLTFPVNKYLEDFDDKDRSLLAQILQGEAKVPTTFDEYKIWPRWLTWLLVGITQSAAFIGYLLLCLDEHYCWYALPWRHGWPFLGMLLFIPGGSPVLILIGGFTLLTKGWGCTKNIISKKSGAGQFDHKAFIHDSRARVEKLRTTIGGKK